MWRAAWGLFATPEPAWRACALPTAFERTFFRRPFCLLRGLLEPTSQQTRLVRPVWPVRLFCQKTSAVLFLMLYKRRACRHPILGKYKHEKHANSRNFGLVRFCICLIFECFACILHHFAFLFGAQFVIFSPPITCFWHLKTHFLTLTLPFLAVLLMAQEGFIYTVVADIYA